jgi:hypothetical protein
MTNPEWERKMRETYGKPLKRGFDGKRDALPSEIEKAVKGGTEPSLDELIDLYPPTEDDIID